MKASPPQGRNPKFEQQRLTKSEWGMVLLLSSINFTHILDFVIVMPLADRLRDELGINPSQFGMLVSAYGIAAMVSGILSASWIDRLDRRTTMMISFAGFILMTLACGLAFDFSTLLLARSLAGLCGGIVSSTIMAIIVDSVVEERRGKAIGVVASSFAVSSTIGLPIGLFLANRFDQFGAPFVAIALLGGFVWALCFRKLPSFTRHREGIRVPPFRQFGRVLRQSNHLWSFAFMTCMIFSTMMIVPFIAPYFEANCGVSRSNLPFVYGSAGVFSLFLINSIGWLTDRIGPRPIFLGAASGSIIMTLFLTNLTGVSLISAMITASLFMGITSSRIVPAQAMMLRGADPSLRGAFTSLNTACSHFATGVAPLLSGILIGEEYQGGPLTNYGSVGWIAIGFGAVAITLSFFLKPFRQLSPIV